MPMLVGWIISAVLWLFKSRIGFLITQIMVWLGVTYTANKVLLTPTINAIKAYATDTSGAGSFGAVAFQWLSYLKFDIALTMVFGALITKHAASAAKLFLTRRVA